MAAIPDYDERYLAGIVHFNRGEYFDAHEVWEDLWRDCPSADRRFYQSLIQAAVALYHWGNGNRSGSERLLHSGRKYMEPYRPRHLGLEIDRLWLAVEAAIAGSEDRPVVELNPSPTHSPEPDNGTDSHPNPVWQ